MVGGRRDRRKTQSYEPDYLRHSCARCVVHSGSDTAARVIFLSFPTMTNSTTTSALRRVQADVDTTLPGGDGCPRLSADFREDAYLSDSGPLRTAIPTILCVLLLLCLPWSAARAQVVADGATNTLNNVTNTLGVSVTIGTNGPFTLLTITNGALLTNSGNGFIGRNVGANSNQVRVTGIGSRWQIGGSLYVGFSNNANQLTISGGGLVGNDIGEIGTTSGSTNNLVFVTGAGTLWSNRDTLLIGNQGTSNRLIVSNGAAVWVGSNAFLGYAATGGRNLADITGTNSQWLIARDLYVGQSNSGNHLLISDGAFVSNRTAYLGFTGASAGNVATVTGPGANWINRGDLHVGYSGSGNQLVVSNGGTVSASNVVVGSISAFLNNRVTVDGGTLRAVNGSGTGALDIRRGTNVFNAGLIETDRLLLTNGTQSVFTFNGGTLITHGGAVNNAQRFVVGAGGTTSAILDLRSNAPLVLSNGFTLGGNTAAAGNQLLITNGGTLSVTGTSYIGTNSTTSNNLAVVSGPGSIWTTSGDLQIRSFERGNQLVISNGGTVVSANSYLVSAFNAALVTGVGSLWTSTNLGVGGNGNGNQLVVSNGGMVDTINGTIGGTLSGENVAVVTGAGSLWTNTSELTVGDYGSWRNQLVVSNGGTVRTGRGYVGRDNFSPALDSRENVAVVTGAGSIWENRLELFVGLQGSGNQLLVSDGGTVASISGTIGYGDSLDPSFGNNNLALVTGAGSLWTNSGHLYVGDFGSGNQLVVSNGGVVAAEFSDVGSSGDNNVALVTGAGSLWTNSSGLRVGDNGDGNQLVVSNGGTVRNTEGYVGTFGNNNVALVTGAGSLWSNSSELYVGVSGSGNQLVVSNGGVVANGSGYLGYNSGANDNVVLITGANSLWSNRNDLLIGQLGSGNQLVVSNGSAVQAASGYVGRFPGSTNNILRLANGTLTVASGLTIGTNNMLSGSGAINGTITNFGTITPGNSLGKITVNGSLFLTNSSLMNFELGGTNAGMDYDQIAVTNFVRFAGNMSLSLLPNYLPDARDTFTLVSFGGSLGTFNGVFNNFRTSFLTNLLSFQVSYDTNLVLSNVRYTDTDGDGQGDLQEQAAGTNPNSSASELTVTSITRNGSGQNVLVFQSVAGKNYRIEFSNDLATWSTATTSVPATGASTQWTDDATLTGGLPGTQRFYRVGLQ